MKNKEMTQQIRHWMESDPYWKSVLEDQKKMNEEMRSSNNPFIKAHFEAEEREKNETESQD